MNPAVFKKFFIGYCFLLCVTTIRFFLEDAVLGLAFHFFLIFHHHYWNFLVLLSVIFWFTVFFRKKFSDFYWIVYFMPVIFIAIVYAKIFNVYNGLVYLSGADFLDNIKSAATFLLYHKNDRAISVELILVFTAIFIYSYSQKSFIKALANTLACYISIICIGTNYISPFEGEALFAVKTSMQQQMWMAFKYMSYVFLMIFVLFRHEIVNFYKENYRFRKTGLLLFPSVELIFLILFGIVPFLKDDCFCFADILVTLVPAAVVSQTLNLLFFTRTKEMIWRKLFLTFHSLIVCVIVLFYLTGWYTGLGSGFTEELSGNSAENSEDNSVFDAVIIGGGLAGLKAAYDLRDLNIKLLEKENRLGGRINTVRCGFDFCELGALFGFSDNLTPENFEHGEVIPANSSFGIYLNRKFYKGGSVYEALRSVNPKDKTFFDEYDRTGDFREFFMKLSPDTKKVVKTAFNVIHPGDFDEYSDMRKQDALTTFRFNQYVGGNFALIEAYAKTLNGRFMLNSEVESVESRKGIVTIQYKEAGILKKIKAKTAIVATPAGVAQKIIRNMNRKAEKFLKSVRYGRGAAVVFETGKNQERDFAYIITPDNGFNTVFFNNTADGKREILTVYFIDSFIKSHPGMKEKDYIQFAERELRKIGIFDNTTMIFYSRARFWESLGTVIPEHYYGFSDDTLNPSDGVFLAGDYTFYDEYKNPYGLESAFSSGEAAARRVRRHLNVAEKHNLSANRTEPADISLKKAAEMFDGKEPLTVCSKYKIADGKPEFIENYQEGDIALYAVLAQALKDTKLAGKVAAQMTEDFQWEYGYGYGGTSFDSSLVLESLISLNIEQEKIEKSLESLAAIYFRKDEGCFATVPENAGQSAYWQGCSADISAHLGYLFYKFDPENIEYAKKSAEYVKKFVNLKNFRSKWFPSNILMPYYAVRLFMIFGGEYRRQLDIIADFLISKQSENGSFNDSVIETSYAVLAMTALKNRELLPNIEKAVSFLKNNKNRYPEPVLYYWVDGERNSKIFFSCYDKGLISEAYRKMALEELKK